MTYLIFAACLWAEPEQCHMRRIPSPREEVGAFCMITAQMTLSEWVRDHPEWKIKEWRCETESR